MLDTEFHKPALPPEKCLHPAISRLVNLDHDLVTKEYPPPQQIVEYIGAVLHLPEGQFRLDLLESAEVENEKEEEQKAQVQPIDPSAFESEWENDFKDVYDETDTIRVRLKNGKLRMTVKIPQYDLDTKNSKVCLRFEIKTRTKEQADVVAQLNKYMESNGTSKTSYKQGKRITLTNGDPAWLNRSNLEDFFIEVDGRDPPLGEVLPKNLVFIKYGKNCRNLEDCKAEEDKKQNFRGRFIANVKATSRTSGGISDTSVSVDKEGPKLEGDDLEKQVDKNTNDVAEYIWNVKRAKIDSAADLKAILTVIAEKTISNISNDNALAYRNWHIDGYGEEVSELPERMSSFYDEFFSRLTQVSNKELSPYELATWVEYTINREIHPFKDACGRISMSWGALVLSITGELQPEYESRDEYYKAMNTGFEQFRAYYLEHVKK